MKLNLIGFFTKDLALKLFALACAVVLWATVSFLGSRTVALANVTPDIVNIPTGLGLGDALPKIKVELRAPRTVNIQNTQDGNQLVRAFIDLSGSGIGERTVPISVTTNIPNATIISVVPNTVTVALDPAVEREVPVRVVPDGNPADGFQLGVIQTDPAAVKVRAALGLFQTLSAGVTAKINVSGIKNNFTGDAYLALPIGVQSSLDRVKVKIAVEQTKINKQVGIRVKTTGTPQNGYFVRGISTDPVTVEIAGNRDLIDTVILIDTEPLNIDGARVERDTNLKLVLPAGIEISSGDGAVRARVDVAPLDDTKQISAGISIRDLPDDLRVANINPAALRVSLRGKNVNTLQDNDAKITISAANRNDETFTYQPQLSDVRTPEQVMAIDVEQMAVSITLERK